MKTSKSLIAISLLMLLCGCDDNINSSSTSIGDEVIIDISEIEYDGHVYAIFHERDMGEFEVVHSPSCGKCLNVSK